ncbi:hypothetical protein MLD38_001690 [Melastoma candidum]|uniref:Uncharacterized protein n=1 Tax=Melastoma candidum TaxID=119954 RepID=A0ACB9SF15_9MYRT|nr:hypothetical protein MLD38_001690 [Melastoma candidum]
MFTGGLDDSAVRWVNEKDRHFPSSNLRARIDPITGTRHGGRGLGLPPTSKFRSGHLPASALPMSRTLHDDAEDSGSASEEDMATDSEEETLGRLYSRKSPPQDERVPNGNCLPQPRNPSRLQTQHASGFAYSDVSSSRETNLGRYGEISVKANGRYSLGQSGYTEESSDSASSYTSTVPSVLNRQAAFEKGGTRVLKKDDYSDEDIPSAPPFGSAVPEIKAEPSPLHGAKWNDLAGFRKSDSLDTKKERVMNSKDPNQSKNSENLRTASGEPVLSSSSQPTRFPAFHASTLGPWHAVIAYEACVKVCLNAWARGCMEAPVFLENECLLLRDKFGLQHVLLQSEEELLAKKCAQLGSEKASAAKPKQMIGKMKVQVRKVKLGFDQPTGCGILSLTRQPSLRLPSMNFESVRQSFSSFQLAVASKWHDLKKMSLAPHMPTNGSFSRQSMAYVSASTRYLKQVSGLFKSGVTSLRNSSMSCEVVQETHSCSLRLKSSPEEDVIRMQPGSGETHVFFPDGAGDDLIIDIHDSKGSYTGRVLAQIATVAEDPVDKLRWWSIYREPEHELIGKLQLYINYSTNSDDNHLKYGTVAETVAYDLVMEVAMKVQEFQQRNLLLDGPWKWLLTEFASYYGVSEIYSKLRYLSYIMDVATPTADCLNLVHDLLLPVILKGQSKGKLSHQENRILGDARDQIEQILALAFENYKSLDESTFSGILDVLRPASCIAAPALEPAIKLYTLLHDVLSPEAQTNLCHYFQAASRKRSRRHMAETDEFLSCGTECILMDTASINAAYQKMTSLCMNIKKEIYADIEIHNQHILPSFVDLPNLSSAIYSTELCNRLRSFLTACPPSGPSPHVTDLVIATADFQSDISSWKIGPVKGGVDAKELFHVYILVWIQDRRLALLESCKLDKVKWSGIRTQHSTTPFVDEMYDRLKETLKNYEIIICRWPEYCFVLENAVADIEKAVVEALDKQYADVLAPLKENLAPKKFGLKYVQKLAKRSVCSYVVPDELGILLNSMKRMLDILRPRVEVQFRTWGSCMPNSGSTAPGERLSEVTVMLRAKFRNYLQAVVEKLAENSKLHPGTKLKKILQDSKGTAIESDVRGSLQPLKEQLATTMNHLHGLFETRVFVSLCRGYWDQMGQDMLSFLENRKENRSWYKGCRIAVSVLDDTFASQMQQLLGNAVQEKDLEPPRSIMEVRSILCKDAPNHKDNPFHY